MPDFRFYLLNHDNHIIGAEEVAGIEETDAAHKAVALLDEKPNADAIEVWGDKHCVLTRRRIG